MSKKLTKILSVILAVVMVACAFAGCAKTPANDDPSSNESASTPVATGKVYKVGICQLAPHPALDAATEGFKRALTEKLGANVEFDEQNAAGETPTCTTIVNNFVTDKVDLIMANATGALQAAMAATADIPIVATSITDYATALEATDWTGKTGINVTGTSDLAPLDRQASMLKELVPEAKKVAILYCSAEPNSKYQSDIVAAELAKMGIETKEFTVADTNDIDAVTRNACDYADCIYVPTDNTLANASSAVNEVASAAKVPVVAGEEGICKGCGIATLSISYDSIGYEAGLMAYEILANGANPGDMEIKSATEFKNEYVAERCEALGITVPDTYEAIKIAE